MARAFDRDITSSVMGNTESPAEGDQRNGADNGVFRSASRVWYIDIGQRATLYTWRAYFRVTPTILLPVSSWGFRVCGARPTEVDSRVRSQEFLAEHSPAPRSNSADLSCGNAHLHVQRPLPKRHLQDSSGTFAYLSRIARVARGLCASNAKPSQPLSIYSSVNSPIVCVSFYRGNRQSNEKIILFSKRIKEISVRFLFPNLF